MVWDQTSVRSTGGNSIGNAVFSFRTAFGAALAMTIGSIGFPFRIAFGPASAQLPLTSKTPATINVDRFFMLTPLCDVMTNSEICWFGFEFDSIVSQQFHFMKFMYGNM